MRLREVQWILQATVPLLDVAEQTRRTHGNDHYVTVQFTGRLQRALQQIQGLSVFKPTAESILQSVAFTSAYDEVEIGLKDFNNLKAQVSTLLGQAQDLLSLVDQLLDEEQPASFSYLLPTIQHKSLGAATERILKIDRIFGATLQRLVATELRVAGLESGSDVVVLELVPALKTVTAVGAASAVVLAAKPALNLVARIYGGAKDLVTFILDAASKLEGLRKLRLENRLLETQVKVNEAATEAKLKEIAAEITSKSLAEFIGRQENPHLLIQRSVADLAAEMKVGAALQFPANTPKSVAEALVAAGVPEALAPANTRKPAPEDAPLALPPQRSEDEPAEAAVTEEPQAPARES